MVYFFIRDIDCGFGYSNLFVVIRNKFLFGLNFVFRSFDRNFRKISLLFILVLFNFVVFMSCIFILSLRFGFEKKYLEIIFIILRYFFFKLVKNGLLSFLSGIKCFFFL